MDIHNFYEQIDVRIRSLEAKSHAFDVANASNASKVQHTPTHPMNIGMEAVVEQQGKQFFTSSSSMLQGVDVEIPSSSDDSTPQYVLYSDQHDFGTVNNVLDETTTAHSADAYVHIDARLIDVEVSPTWDWDNITTTEEPCSLEDVPLQKVTQRSPKSPSLALVVPLLMDKNHETFDQMVTDFYCADLRCHPRAAHEQRRSRRKGLATFFSETFLNSQEWTSWECDEFHSALVNAAETVLLSESECTRASLRSDFQSTLANNDGDTLPMSVYCERLLLLKDRLAKEAPYLWTLAMTIATTSTSIHGLHSDCSGRVLLALFILLFPELLNEGDLMRMICNMFPVASPVYVDPEMHVD